MRIREWAITLVMFLLSGCAHQSGPRTFAPEGAHVEGTQSATLVFGPGEATLTDEIKQELNELAIKTNRDGREIARYRVLAWPDKEYPEKRENKADVKLAEARAQKVKKFLTRELGATEQVQTFNMAEKTGALSSALRSDEWEIKEAYAATGATGTRLPSGQVSYTKASKALVIVEYKETI